MFDGSAFGVPMDEQYLAGKQLKAAVYALGKPLRRIRQSSEVGEFPLDRLWTARSAVATK